ncbi:hypothetical protein [Salinibacter sp.]|uniref:hypothetical protein n=1 Tax=Salinibacter sp. TaxID=2065818 RepID=UPI0021E78697|nr:hypothetical protein [Salinibacter sp.]
MAEYQYTGVKMKQQPEGPELFLTKVPAVELLRWADVPRKKAEFQAGYQRQLRTSRTENIKNFIETSPNNLIPGALLVSVNEDYIEYKEKSKGVHEIEIKSKEDMSTDDLIENTYLSFYKRLNEEEKKFANGELDVDIEELEEGSPLPSSYLAELTRELKQAHEDFDGLDDDRKEVVKDYIEDISKPGRILDGQHRVFGAKDVADFDVTFPVVLMPGLSDSEQVFHFFIVNNKAKPLKPVELRSTISTSLTDKEINELYKRLDEAGVRAEEAKLTYRMNRNPNSPFQGLIDFGLDEDQSFIPENVANKLVLDFVKLSSRFSPLYEGVDEWENDSEFNYRISMFFAFWRAVKEKYPNAWRMGVENGEGQLFYKVSMLKLQEKILESLKPMNDLEKSNTGVPVLGDKQTLTKLVGIVLDQLNERFWVDEWQMSVNDHSEFREFLKDQMQKAMDGSDIGRLKLFRETS